MTSPLPGEAASAVRTYTGAKALNDTARPSFTRAVAYVPTSNLTSEHRCRGQFVRQICFPPIKNKNLKS